MGRTSSTAGASASSRGSSASDSGGADSVSNTPSSSGVRSSLSPGRSGLRGRGRGGSSRRLLASAMSHSPSQIAGAGGEECRKHFLLPAGCGDDGRFASGAEKPQRRAYYKDRIFFTSYSLRGRENPRVQVKVRSGE